jgi:hypothetical protein
MGSFPVMEFKAKTDFLAWVGSGILAHPHCSIFMRSVSRDGATVLMPLAGNCVVFLGDYKNVQFMNDLFGFTLQTSCVLPFTLRLPLVCRLALSALLTPLFYPGTKRDRTTRTTAIRPVHPSSLALRSCQSRAPLAPCASPRPRSLPPPAACVTVACHSLISAPLT